MTGPADPTDAAPPAGNGKDLITLGRFGIHELIAVGGMAEVYRASMEGPGGFRKPVVIKRVKKKHAEQEEFTKMFIDEAKLSAKLEHPNIVSVFELGKAKGDYYIAMEYIDGLNLHAAHVRQEQKHKTPIPWQAVTLIIRDVLRALEHAHGMTDDQGKPLGIIHRDVNLANVMIRRDGVVKVLDFGIAKAREGIRAAETMEGVLKGKFSYMSPEQVRGEPLDHRSDVFATSIIYHELLTGRKLFGGEDPMSILMAIKEAPIQDPAKFNPQIPQAVSMACLKGLSRDVAARYQSAGEMADALEEIVYEHRIKATALRDIMADIMPAQAPPLSVEETASRRHITLTAWNEGAPDAQPDAAGETDTGAAPVFPQRSASGVLGAATAGKEGSASTPLGGLAGAPLHTTEPWWQIPEDQLAEMTSPGEGDTVVDPKEIQQIFLKELQDQKTHILSEADAQKTEIGKKDGDEVASGPEATPAHLEEVCEQKTEILTEEHPGAAELAAVQDQKTTILEDVQPEDTETEPKEQREPERDPGGTAEVHLPESSKSPEDPSRRMKILVAVVAAVIIAAFIIWKLV